MYFSRWEPPGECERMWRVNLEVSISEGNLPRRWHSSRPSDKLRSTLTSTGVRWGWLQYAGEHVGALERTLGTPGSHQTKARIRNILWMRPVFLWVLFRQTAGGSRYSPYVHERSIFLNAKYDAWIVGYYHFWILLAIIFFNIESFDWLH